MDDNIPQIPTPPKPVAEPIAAVSYEVPTPPQPLSSAGDFETDFSYKPGLWQRIKDFFSDRRKLVATVAILIVVLGGLTAYLIVKRGQNKNISDAPASSGGELPLAGQKKGDFVLNLYSPADGVVVATWKTLKPTDGRLDYGFTQNYGYFAYDPASLKPNQYSRSHSISIRGLNPTKTYNFQASSKDIDGKIYYSGNIELRPTKDGQKPKVTIKLRDGANLSGKAQVCFSYEDNRPIAWSVITIDKRPIVRTEGSANCADVDTTNFSNGNHILGVEISDGNNSGGEEIEVIIGNPPGPGGPGAGIPGPGGPTIPEPGDVFYCRVLSDQIIATVTQPTSVNVSGVIELQASVSAPSGMVIQKVQYALNYSIIAEATAAPYRVNFDTAQYSDGTYEIEAIARTEDGTCSNYLNQNGRTFNFSNYGDQTNNFPVISNVSAQTTQSTINLSWTTNVNTDSRLEYSSDAEAAKTKTDAVQTQSHQLRLEGLTADVNYYIVVRGATASGIQAPPVYVVARTVNGSSDGLVCSGEAIDEWLVCYYNDADLTDLKIVGRENVLDHTWSDAQSPDITIIEPTSFSASWQGSFAFENALYEFSLRVDDGARLYIDGQKVIDKWFDQAANTYTYRRSLTAGRHIVRVEYYQSSGDGVVRLSGTKISDDSDRPGVCAELDDSITATITQPASGAIMADTTEIVAIVESQSTIREVLFILTGSAGSAVFATDTSSPYKADLNTTLYDNGEYRLTAVALTTTGACSSWSGGNSVTINNTGLQLKEVTILPDDISAVVSIKSPEPVTGTIYYGEQSDELDQTLNFSNGSVSNEEERTYSYSAFIGNLSPEKAYFYKVVATSVINPNRETETYLDYFVTRSGPSSHNLTASINWSDTCQGTGSVYFDRFSHSQLSGYTNSSHGGKVDAAVNPTSGGASYTAVLIGLSSGTLYHYRYVTNCSGRITISDDKVFTTP